MANEKWVSSTGVNVEYSQTLQNMKFGLGLVGP
jgi:hypothetical protein